MFFAWQDKKHRKNSQLTEFPLSFIGIQVGSPGGSILSDFFGVVNTPHKKPVRLRKWKKRYCLEKNVPFHAKQLC